MGILFYFDNMRFSKYPSGTKFEVTVDFPLMFSSDDIKRYLELANMICLNKQEQSELIRIRRSIAKAVDCNDVEIIVSGEVLIVHLYWFPIRMKATDRNKLIDRIKTLEGLTDDERAALLGLLNETKTYGLVWEDKPEEVEERLRMELPVLKEVRSRAIISDNADSPNHILIEGDNLEALTTLAYTHEGKIDVIYIDPPYNTGKKDFVYNDTFIDSEDSFRHSKWLSFISRRLETV